ncbi:hypothetical protein [Candidatus Tisiphia endosymbiont of Temnostethus pusillus]|uniref:hypothetical protein n=1 Tax=Candidatus Tisiphia endosymbiont of Temnostethus pusillus TaxID=3139335 RepID=UPI0035C917F7
MTNDLDNDASKRNFIKKEYEKLEGRVRNATSRTQLALIIADAGSLALMASQLGIDIGILELIATAVSKTLDYETTEQIQVVDFNEGIRLAKEQEKIDREHKFQGIYKAFDSFYDDSLNRQRKDNESLHEIFEATKAGRKLTEEEKQKFSKTPEQIKEENARSKHMRLTKKLAKIEREHHSNEIKKIEEYEEQVKHLSENHPERVLLANQKKHHEDYCNLVNKKIDQYKAYKQGIKQQAYNICLNKELAENNRCNEGLVQSWEEVFHKIYDITPEEMAKKLTPMEKQPQTFITLPPSKSRSTLSSKSLAVPVSQQELDTKQIISDYKLEKHMGILSGKENKDTQLQRTNSINLNNPKDKDTSKGRGGRD